MQIYSSMTSIDPPNLLTLMLTEQSRGLLLLIAKNAVSTQNVIAHLSRNKTIFGMRTLLVGKFVQVKNKGHTIDTIVLVSGAGNMGFF